MARHRKDFTGDRYTARITALLTPADRAALDEASEQMGMNPSAFARLWIMKGVAATKAVRGRLVAQRTLDRQLADELVPCGQSLNGLAKQANETQAITDERAIAATIRQLTAILGRIEAPPPGEQRASMERIALMNEVTRIGNNIMQLQKIAKARQRGECLAALDQFQDRIVACVERMVSG